MRLLQVLALFLVVAAPGCGLVEEPPTAGPAEIAPPLVAEVAAAQGISAVRVPLLSRDGFQRRAERITVRVRNLSCRGVGTGSGFAVDDSTLVTNRHVVAGADLLEINTFEGRTLEVTAAQVGVLGDVAFVTVDGALPVVADLGGRAPPGSEIAAVGYPLGGPLTLSRGTVIDRVPGDGFGVQGPVVRINAEIQPGNSGGPLLDRRGRVAGVVYAIEVGTGFGLAIPMDTVDALLSAAGTADVPPCGAE